MAISNVDDLYNELSGSENFSGLFNSPEELASTLEGMSPERRDAFFEKVGLSEQVSKVDFDKVLKKKEDFSSSFQLAGDNQAQPKPTPQNKPAISNPLQPTGANQNIPSPIKLFPDEPAPGSPFKRKTLEERFPQTEEEKKKQKAVEGIQAVMKEQREKKDIYTPPKKKEITKADIDFQRQLEEDRRRQSDMPQVKKIDWEAIAEGKEFVKQTQLVKEQKEQEALANAKGSAGSLFDGIKKGMYDYVLPSGERFQLDEYAIGRALFENEPIEVFSKSGTKVDILDPTKDLLSGESNFNTIDERSIGDHLQKLGLTEEQADEEILRLKKVYLQQGAKAASQNLYEQLLTKWNGNQALANQNYINYWNNRGLDLLEGSEKEAYHIVKQMEAIRSQLLQAEKKGGLSSYSTGQIQSYRKQLDDLQDQLSELRDNPNNLYDWRTGQFIDARIQKNQPRVAEIQQENEEFQAKYGDKPKEALVKRRDELLAQRAFIMGKMRESGLDIPEEGTWDAAVRALQISAAQTAGTGLITLPDGRQVSSDVYKRKMDDYNSQLYSVMSELYGLNRAVMLNENVALRKESESLLGSFLKNVGIAAESIGREFTPGATTEDANSEYNIRNSLLDALEQSGYTVDPSLRSSASASVSETITGSAGMLVNSMLQIALGNMAVPEIMSLRWAKRFKDIMTTKYGNIGGAVFEQTANAVRSGLIFEASGQGFSTGVGESGAQAAFDALNLDRILGAKGRLSQFLYRTLIGGAGETFEEVAGQYIQGLTDAGFDPNKAFRDSFGVAPESRMDQLMVIGITSLGFSGASNLKILTATRSNLQQILDDPKVAAAYGDVLTPEKKQQIEDVLKAIDDKLADKQSRETNQGVTASESSEYTPRVDAEQTKQQVNLINEERQKALEELTANGEPESEEQKTQLEQKIADTNAFYDQKIAEVMPKQTTFDTATGTNANAVMAGADLNSQETQDFLASIPNARARRNAATLIAVANNANTTLQSVLPNAKVVLHSRDSFRDKMSQVGEKADRKGNFSIIQNADGTYDIEIQINVEDGKVLDIAHEVTHGVLFSKFYGDDKRMAEIAEVKANTELTPEESTAQIQEINKKYETQFSETLGSFRDQLKDLVNERGNKYLDNFVSAYGEDAKAEEYLVELTAILAQNGEQIRQEDPTFFERLLALLNRLVGVIGKEAGIKLQKFENTQEVVDFFNTVASSIRKGEAITETKIPQRNAVQEQTTGQVSVQPEARVGQEVEERKPQTEPQGTPQNKARKEEVRKDLEEKLAKGEIDDVTLSLLEDYGKQLAKGEIVYDRFLEEENTGFVSGGEILAESTVLAGRNEGADETQDERVERQEADLEAYAKLKGIWIENTEEFLEEKYGEPLGSGQESIVFGTPEGTVIKTSNTNQYVDHAAAIDSIVLSNAYFPEAAQKIIGFGLDSDGEFQIVTEQQYFPQDEDITQEEIIEFLGNLGFKLNTKEWSGEGTRFITDAVLLNDASPKNFIKTNGVLLPIDVIMKINPERMGLEKSVTTEAKIESTLEEKENLKDVRNKARKIEFEKNTGNISIDGKKVDIPMPLMESLNSIPNALEFASQSQIPTNIEFKRALQDRFQNSVLPSLKKYYGEEFDPTKQDALLKSYLVDAYTFETLIAMKSFPDALGWYDAKTKAAMEIMSLVHPEIATDPIAAGMFKIAVAVTSNGNKVNDNFIEADRQYNYFKENGKFDENQSIGTQSSGIKATFKLTNEILKTLSKEQFLKFLTSKFRAGDLKYIDKNGKSSALLAGFNVDTEVFGASIFGPKIGNGFFMNLYGDFSQLTMDRWFMRQYGRLTGGLLKVDPKKVAEGETRVTNALKALTAKEKTTLASLIPNYQSLTKQQLAEQISKVSSKKEKREVLQANPKLDELRKAGNNLDKTAKGEVEAPNGGKQRAFIIDVFDTVQKRLKDEYDLDITIADLQAVNWYPEKALYQTFQEGKTEEIGAEETSDNEQPDYESAAKRLAKKYGYNEKQINEKLLNEDGTRKFDTGGNQEFGRNHSDVGVELVKKQILDVKSNLAKVKNKARVEPWSTPQQEISSASTSINKAKLPSVYSDKKFFDILKAVPGKSIVIADIGSGKYANVNIKPLLEKGEIAEFINDSSKKMLSEKALPALEEVLGGKDITYLPYDPFNQPAEVNEATISAVRGGNADVAVSPNVLNVIAEAGAREGVIANLADAVGTRGTAIIQIYEGEPKDRGVGKETKTAGETSWQNNQKTDWYVPEVQAYFANVKRSGNIIIADNKGQTKLDFGINGSQKLEVRNKARIEEKIKESKAYKIPQRYKGDVGKMIGGDLYVHYSANDVLPQGPLQEAESKLPEDFEYEVIKYNAADGSFSFIASPDWNTSHEPIVGDSYKVKKNGEVSITKQKADPQIYHHKWNFVRDDYKGFDVEKSIQRSIDWYRDAKDDINMFKIGTQSYWKENALPLIKDTTPIINKGRKDRVDFAIVKDYEDFRRQGFSVEGAYFELEKMNYAPGDIKRYIPEIGEAWKKRSVNKFFATIRKHRGKITKRQGKIREELENNPGLDFDTLYDMLKDKYEDFELFKAFYEEGANPVDLDKIFGTEYRQTIQKAMNETRDGRTVYNKDFLRTLREDARARKMMNAANQMNNLFGFFNGAIDNEQMIAILADGLEESGLEFSLQVVTDEMRQKRAELEQDLNTLKKIGKGEINPNTMVDVARLLSLAGRMLRMGRGLFKNQESFEKAIFSYLENASYKTELGITQRFKAFKLTETQKKKIREAIKNFREAKAEYDKEIELLQDSDSAYTDAQFEAFDKAKIKFEQSARKLKITIDAFQRKGMTNWFTSMTALALLSFRTLVVGLTGNLEMMLANTPKRGKFLILGWSRALANKLVSAFAKTSGSQFDKMIKRGAYGNVDPTLYRKLSWDQGVQQIRNIFENTIASTSTSEDSFFSATTVADSTKELPESFKMILALMKNLFKKGVDKITDKEWAEQFDQLLVMMQEKDEEGNHILELMNPKGYQAATKLVRGIFGYIPTSVGKAIALSGDRVFYQLGYYEALASYAYSQGITDPNEVKKFIRLNSIPNSIASEMAEREGNRRIFAQDNNFVDWFTKTRGEWAKKEANIYANSVIGKKVGENFFKRTYKAISRKIGLATKKMGLTALSPFTRIPSNFIITGLEKTLFPVSAAFFFRNLNKLNRMIAEYEERFNVDEYETLSPTKQKQQEQARVAIFEQQRITSRYLTSTFQGMQLVALGGLLLASGAIGAPYGDEDEEKAAARAAGVANQPPGKINVSAFIDYILNGFERRPGDLYQEGDFTFQYTNLGIFGFGLTWASTLINSLAAKVNENKKIIGAPETGYESVTLNMIANSVSNGITSLSFLQNIASLASSVRTAGEQMENFGLNIAKTVLTVPTMAYGVFGGIEKAEGITIDNMRNYYPDLEADESIGSRFKLKLWTSLTGKSPIALFGLKNSKDEFLSPFASPYYEPQIGPHGEELYKKNTFWDVRSGKLSDRVAAYLQATFDPFAFSDYEGFVSSVKKYNAEDSYEKGDILDYSPNGNIYAVLKPLKPGFKLENLNQDPNNPDVELITDATKYFDRQDFVRNKSGAEATTNLYNLVALYSKATGSRKEFSVLNKFYEPFIKGKDGQGEFGVYIPIKYQRELAKLRGDVIRNSYDQTMVKERIKTIQNAANEMEDEEFKAFVEEQVEGLFFGPMDAISYSRTGGIQTQINDALGQLENSERYRVIKKNALIEGVKSGLWTEEQFDRLANAEGTNTILQGLDKSKLKFKK